MAMPMTQITCKAGAKAKDQPKLIKVIYKNMSQRPRDTSSADIAPGGLPRFR